MHFHGDKKKPIYNKDDVKIGNLMRMMTSNGL